MIVEFEWRQCAKWLGWREHRPCGRVLRAFGWQSHDVSDYVIEVILIGQCRCESRHLGTGNVILMLTAHTGKKALIRLLKVPISGSGQSRRPEDRIAQCITTMAGTTKMGVIIFASRCVAFSRGLWPRGG